MCKQSLFLLSLLTLAACGGAPSSSSTAAATTDRTPASAGAPSAPSDPSQPNPGAPPAPAAPAAASAPGHHRCGWIGPGDSAGADTFAAHADFYEAIHPDWYALNADGVSFRALSGSDSPTVVGAARSHHVALIPLIAAVEDASYLRAVFADAGKRDAHVKALVDLATSHGYDGIDIDYEHLWDASDRAGYTALMTELAAQLHAAGKVLTIAMPALPDAGNVNNAWDVNALVGIVDHIHIMGYDFHTLGTHEGPLAPLGSIDASTRRAADTGHPEKFVLGLPNYGVTTSYAPNSQDAMRACGGAGNYAVTDGHMGSCSFGVYDAGRTPNCQTPQGHLYFEDLQSLEEKVQVAQKHGIGGITYWTVGSEPDGFFDMVRKYY